jgi:hypothetical protein
MGYEGGTSMTTWTTELEATVEVDEELKGLDGSPCLQRFRSRSRHWCSAPGGTVDLH